MNDHEEHTCSQSAFTGDELVRSRSQASLESRFPFRHHPHDLPEERMGRTKVDDGSILIKTENPDSDEEASERALRSGIATVINLIDDNPLQPTNYDSAERRISKQPPRNPISDSQCRLPFFNHSWDSGMSVKLRPGMVVEINEIKGLYHATFLQIQHIIRASDQIILRGLPLTRTRCLRGQLPRLRNEACLILRLDNDDARDNTVQAAVEIPINNVLGVRKLHYTNTNFPDKRFQGDSYRTVEDVERDAVLICRWKFLLLYRSAAARENKESPYQYIIANIQAGDVSESAYRMSDAAKLNRWRGSKVRGGSYNKDSKQDLEAVEDLDGSFGDEQDWIDKQPGQRYTMGDMFSGAGGTSLGAKQAGFHIRVACDNSQQACATHRQNFPDADLREEDIWKFIREDLVWGGKGHYVDVLHLSPPCQFWSPAHTVAGKNDEANIAVLFSCQELVAKLKPRVFTLEQTFGILHPKFEHYFNALIHGFTQYNYSVRWKVVNLLEWGLPSRRTRLIMIGACPGESLPTFPDITHGRGLLPFVTVMDAMRRIPPDATMHEKYQEKDRIHWWKKWDPDVHLARCITTHGGYGNYHYNGKRHFTPRELATMNGFHATYQFHHKNAKKQIGNAFPPCAVRLLYDHLLKWLENEDRVNSVEDQSTYEEEPTYDVVDSDIEDDLELVSVRVKRQKTAGSNGGFEMVNVEVQPRCIDFTQPADEYRGSIVDLTTTETPSVPGSPTPIVIRDDHDDNDNNDNEE